MGEDLYSRRCESNSSVQLRAFLPELILYKDALKKLYTLILKFLASTICYYSTSTVTRISRDIVKWNSWDLLADIKIQEAVFREIINVWKDTRYEEERIAFEKRHREIIKRGNSIGNDVSSLRKDIEYAQRDSRRRALLDWLSSIDPSENYNSARKRHVTETGDWLIKGNEDFKHWEHAPNSLLWLHGKGNTIAH
jgi:hypothetical protein